MSLDDADAPVDAAWPRKPVPLHAVLWAETLHRPRDLASARTALRAHLRGIGHALVATPHVPAGAGTSRTVAAELDEAGERVLLAADEMVSNGIRHGEAPVVLTVARPQQAGAYLLTVTDHAAHSGPRPDPDRDHSRGGLGLLIIAAYATTHRHSYGWWPEGNSKTVWALVAATA